MKLILKTEEYTGCMVMQKEHNISPKRRRLNRGKLPKYKVDGNCSAPAVVAAVQGDALRSAHSPRPWRGSPNRSARRIFAEKRGFRQLLPHIICACGRKLCEETGVLNSYEYQIIQC